MAKEAINYKGYNTPFLSDSQVFPFQTNERLIKNDLVQLLLTGLRERVMRPTYGTPIKSYVFEPLTLRDINILTQQIREAVSTYEPRVSIVDIRAGADEARNYLLLKIFFTVTNIPNRTLSIDLNIDINQASGAVNGRQ